MHRELRAFGNLFAAAIRLDPHIQGQSVETVALLARANLAQLLPKVQGRTQKVIFNSLAQPEGFTLIQVPCSAAWTQLQPLWGLFPPD